MMDVRKIEPEAMLKAGLAEMKGCSSEWGKKRHVLISEDEDTGDERVSVMDIKSCKLGCQNGIKIKNYRGNVWAAPCKCSEHLSRRHKEIIDNVSTEICKSGMPPLFANRSYNGRAFDDVVPQVLKQWLSDVCSGSPPEDSCIFLCGAVGNGKTHLASDCIKRYIMATGWQARYLTASELVETKKDAVVYGDRKHRDDKSQLDYFKRVMNYGGLVVVDEIRDSISKTEGSYLEEFIDKRYRSGLPTIFISNHTFRKKTSYGGITIQSFLSHRVTDRMRSSLYYEFNAPSRRGVRTPDSYTIEEVNTFSLPKSVLAQKKGELQILNWMTRNPLFEPIRRDQRDVVEEHNGSAVMGLGLQADVVRKTHRDIWQRGDALTMYGPALSEIDVKTYLVCLDMLKQQHCQGKYGLTIGTRAGDIMLALGKRSNTPANREATHRSLLRISLASMSYVDNIGRQWTGPLFHFYRPDVNIDYYQITFNESMITFYQTSEYTRLHRSLFEAKIGTDGIRMQMFLRSHKAQIFEGFNVDKWLKFLEKPVDKMDDSSAGKRLRRQFRNKFLELVRKQKQAGLLTADSCVKRDGKTFLTVTPL